MKIHVCRSLLTWKNHLSRQKRIGNGSKRRQNIYNKLLSHKHQFCNTWYLKLSCVYRGELSTPEFLLLWQQMIENLVPRWRQQVVTLHTLLTSLLITISCTMWLLSLTSLLLLLRFHAYGSCLLWHFPPISSNWLEPDHVITMFTLLWRSK